MDETETVKWGTKLKFKNPVENCNHRLEPKSRGNQHKTYQNLGKNSTKREVHSKKVAILKMERYNISNLMMHPKVLEK